MPWIIELVTAHSGHAGPQFGSSSGLWAAPLVSSSPSSRKLLGDLVAVAPARGQSCPLPATPRLQSSDQLRAPGSPPHAPPGLGWRRSRVYNRAIKITAHIYLVLRIHCYHWSIPHNHQETRTPHKGNPCSFYPNQDPGTRKGLRTDRERGKGWETYYFDIFCFCS